MQFKSNRAIRGLLQTISNKLLESRTFSGPWVWLWVHKWPRIPHFNGPKNDGQTFLQSSRPDSKRWLPSWHCIAAWVENGGISPPDGHRMMIHPLNVGVRYHVSDMAVQGQTCLTRFDGFFLPSPPSERASTLRNVPAEHAQPEGRDHQRWVHSVGGFKGYPMLQIMIN